MAIAKRPSIFFHSILLASMVSLVACGGGGGGGTKPPAIDTTPNAISFAPTSNAEPSAVVTSQAITISGINTAAPISISGGEYAIAGGAFTATPGTVTNSQSLVIRITASDKTNTPKEATLTVGGVSAKFTVTTFADTTPDAFSFPAKTEAVFNTEYTSDAITVKGIDVAVPVSITGGTYSINGGAFTSAAGTVSADQTITVKTTSASKTESTQSAVLTVGGVDGNFAVTTINDTFPPVAEFKFPTPYTMSEASEVKVRGTATDDNAITSVKLLVNGTTEIPVTPKATGDFSSWTATVSLTANSENEIKVIATDDRNNTTVTANANKVQIRQANVKSAFPDTANEIKVTSVVLDKYDGRNRALIADFSGSDRRVIAVDLTTGSRTLAFTAPDCSLFALTIDPVTKYLYGVCEAKLYEFNLSDGAPINSYDITGASSWVPIYSMALDRSNGRSRLILAEPNSSNTDETGKLLAFSLETKTTSTISAEDQPLPFESGQAMIVHGDQYLVADGDFSSNFGSRIIAVDVISGTRSILSDNSIGSGDSYGGTGYFDMPHLTGIAKDEKLNRLFVFEYWSSRIFAVDLTTFNRKIFSNLAYSQAGIIRNTADVLDMKIDEQQELLVLAEGGRNAIIIVDMETGEKAILSKSRDIRN
jgi:hypothetical protein